VMFLLGNASAPIGMLVFGALAEVTSSRSVIWVAAVLLGAMIFILAIRIGRMGRRLPLTSG
jgi:hypothetical protein